MYLYIMDLRDSLMPGEYRDDENPLRLSNALIAGEPDDVEFMGCIANCNNRQGIDKRACEELCRAERLEREQREQRIDFEVAELLADVEEEMKEGGGGVPLHEVTGSEARRRAALFHNAAVLRRLQPVPLAPSRRRPRDGTLRRGPRDARGQNKSERFYSQEYWYFCPWRRTQGQVLVWV